MSKNNVITYPFIGGLILVFLFVLMVAWALLSPLIGVGYKYARMVETLSLWQFSDYGHYFMSTKFPEEYNFYSIFWSSLPFGVFFTCAIFILGLYAQHRIETMHINATIQHKNGVGLTPNELMRRMSPLYPHNQFYLNFPLDRYNMESGAASMPLTAIQLLVDAEAINISDAKDFSDASDYTVDKDRLKAALGSRFGPINPFLSANWNNPAHIANIVDHLEWHHVVILYACIARIDALITGVGDEYEKKLVDIDEYMKSIWRAINREHDDLAKKGKTLMLGPYEVDTEDDSKETDKKIVLLHEHLKKVAPKWSAVQHAHAELGKLLAKPISEKSKKNLSAEIERIFKHHGYLSGVLASALVETRFAGIFNPATFNWMRFYDLNLWRFLNYIGMNTPCPECAGVFDHWQTETMAGLPLTEPEISMTTVDNIIREARKYTPKNLRVTDADKLASTIFDSTSDAAAIIRKMQQFSET